MPTNNEIYNEVVAYFMTAYPVNSKPILTEQAIISFLKKKYSDETISEFLTDHKRKIFSFLVNEFNERYGKNKTLRFKILDEQGLKISGFGLKRNIGELKFQDVINELLPEEFETLSAYVLKLLGCEKVWFTQRTNDQGIDSFGYKFLVPTEEFESEFLPKFFYLAQAKHFKKTTVGTKEVREFVGSVELAIHKIFSEANKNYSDLELLPFAPISLVLITTEEVSVFAKRIAKLSGVVLLSSDDLSKLFFKSWRVNPRTVKKKMIKKNLKACRKKIPIARLEVSGAA